MLVVKIIDNRRSHENETSEEGNGYGNAVLGNWSGGSRVGAVWPGFPQDRAVPRKGECVQYAPDPLLTRSPSFVAATGLGGGCHNSRCCVQQGSNPAASTQYVLLRSGEVPAPGRGGSCRARTRLGRRRTAHARAIFGWIYAWAMSKFEHMSDKRAVNHAAMIGHLARGTVIEGKSYSEALEGAREAVGEDSKEFVRQSAGDDADERDARYQAEMETRSRLEDEYGAFDY